MGESKSSKLVDVTNSKVIVGEITFIMLLSVTKSNLLDVTNTNMIAGLTDITYGSVSN